MKKYNLQRLAPYLLISTILLSGCAKKNNTPICNEESSHVHLYTKELDSGIYLTTYFDSEEENVLGFDWNPATIEATEEEKEAYALLAENGLFNGIIHWDYLYNEIIHNKDFMEYYFEYTTKEPILNKEGTETGSMLVPHSGWTRDIKASHLTGKCRVCHPVYYAYRLIKVDGHYQLERSPLVDDIRDVLVAFPYVCEGNYCLAYHDVELTEDLRNRLDIDNFTFFDHPDLSKVDSKVLKLTRQKNQE